MTIEEVHEQIEQIRRSIYSTNDPASAYAVLGLIEVIEAQQQVIEFLCERSARCRDAGIV